MRPPPRRQEAQKGIRPVKAPATNLNALPFRKPQLVRDYRQAPWNVQINGENTLHHNHLQLVGEADSVPCPHTDSRKLCRNAAVLYLTPEPERRAGTSFYRLCLPNGALGGNHCPAPHANLREALSVTHLRFSAWAKMLAIANELNRLLLYRAEFVHSASAYFRAASRIADDGSIPLDGLRGCCESLVDNPELPIISPTATITVRCRARQRRHG